MSFGYNGRILRVDLSRGEVTVEDVREAFFRTYFGGRGFIVHRLLNDVPRGADALSEENRLVFATGVFTGSGLAGSGRNSVGAKSPLTNAYGEAEAGGFWGAELKRTGYDAIVVEGKAAHPVYLSILGDEVQMRDARHLWGMTTGESCAAITREIGDARVRLAQIGPAGENLARLASIINDLKHAAGRTGLGAVMGSKNLKAIAVRGPKGPPMADAKKVQSFVKWFGAAYIELSGGLHDVGTSDGVLYFARNGGLPTRNFREGTFTGAENISGERMRDTILVGRGSCFACPVCCKREVKVNGRYDVDPSYGGPEYETLAALGSNCGVDDLEAVAKANELCNAYGLDTIGTGATIAFAMECFENGLITEKETGGLRLTFGNAKAMVTMVEAIARRQGIGEILAEGTLRAAREIGKGAERFAMQIKGQELPMHEPRLKPGMGIGYAISPTGAEHMMSIHDDIYKKAGADLDKVRTLGVLAPIPQKHLGPEKLRLMVYLSHWQSFLNCIDMCFFMPYGFDQVLEMVRAITGWNCSLWELLKVGERATTLTRVFNLREGLTADDDRLPERMFTGQPSGPLADGALKEEAVKSAIQTYFDMMGWDTATGAPGRGKLEELGIGWAAECLR
ncbi:MAG: aldehyde ferredoxin oxidoreductase family protein [Chloroflexi bacterium]|nr:aldehyde ferredoxin oxidoreductase family protein [Chloroflexota bacterium]